MITPAQYFKVNEIFYSIQGEGLHTGMPAVFVRFSGCAMKCSFCDTDHSHKTNLTAQQVLSEIQNFPAKTVIITGGEPAEQDVALLAKTLKAAGYSVHIETNGSICFDTQDIDHVAVSPKKYVDAKMLQRANVIKIVVSAETDLEDLKKYFAYAAPQRLIYLQPQSNLQENIDLCVEIIKQNPFLRLSLQAHKFAKIQ